MSDWLFDLGNSRFKFAPCRDGQPGAAKAIGHVDGAAAEGWQQQLPAGTRAWVASVAAPGLTDAVLAALSARFDQVQVVRSQAQCGRLRIAYPQPHKFGVDRFLALLAAAAEPEPVLIAGVGTALTIDLLDADGQHRGGRIAPSPTVMRQALHARAVQLPETGGDYHEFAIDTEDALASGCDGAAVALIERSLAHATQLLGGAVSLVIHGGGADALRPLLPQASLRPGLVLEGLAQWAHHHDRASR